MSHVTTDMAFPQLRDGGQDGGMTLRQWYAGLAMQGLLANENFGCSAAEYIADLAFKQADAMMKEGA